jgi:hypothetical protein
MEDLVELGREIGKVKILSDEEIKSGVRKLIDRIRRG